MNKPDDLQLALNHALSSHALSRTRESLMSGGMSLDTKRTQSYCEFGWPEKLDFSDFIKLYRRGGIAHGAINKIIGACWKTAPWIIEGDDQDKAKDETPWERTLKPLFNGGRFWRAVAEADRRRLVGRYSGLLIQLRDSGRWDQPVKKRGALVVKLIPAWAGSLKPAGFNTNAQDEGYGQVTKWQYKEDDVDGKRGRQLDIHPDRVFILGDWSSDAIGFLEPAFNAFVSLEKVEGGSGESFLKNAARQLSVSFDKEVNLNDIASMYGVSIDKLHEKFNDAARDMNRGNDVMLINQGASVAPLVTAVADPEPTYSVNLQTAAAAIDIPTRILVGNQSGERSSTEDQKYFNGRCQSRRESELSFEIHDLMTHMARIGVVKPVAEFTAVWDDLTESTLGERLANVKIMADVNVSALAQGEAVFSNDEMRETAGYDAQADSEKLPDVDDEDEDGTSTDPAVE